MVEPDRGPPNRARRGSSPSTWGLLLAVGLAGLAAGWLLGFTAESGPASTSSTAPSTAETTTTSVASSAATTSLTSGSEATTTTGRLPALKGMVELLPGATDLKGTVALSVPLAFGDTNLWVIQPGGRMVQRTDVQTKPGGYEFPLMVVGDHVLFTTHEGVFRIGANLTGEVDRIAPAGMLVPSPTSDVAWLVGGDVPSWFARFDGGTGELGERTEISEGFGWPLTGLADGVLFDPEDDAPFDRVAFWPSGGEPEPFDVELGSQSGISSIVGNHAAIVSPGHQVTILDLTTDEQLATLSFDPAEGNTVSTCLSEDSRYLAAISSTGSLEVFETSTGESRGRVSTTEPPLAAGWASPSQLMFVSARTRTEAFLHVLDPDARVSTAIARLTARSPWHLAASSTPC